MISSFIDRSKLVKRFETIPEVPLIVGKSIDVIGKGSVEAVVVYRFPSLDEDSYHCIVV